MNIKKIYFTRLFLAAVACFSSTGWALPPTQLVESVPLETDLTVPGTRPTQDVWVEMIKAATTTLDLEQFYISDQSGEALEPVINEIRNAAGRGVQVRILIDSDFFKTYPQPATDLGSLNNIETRTIDFSSTGGVQHAKYFVVDGKDNFVGSQNFDWRALSHIHELGLRVTDTSISSTLESLFEMDWANGVTVGSHKRAKHTVIGSGAHDDQGLQLVGAPGNMLPSGIGYSLDAITGLIAGAQQSIQIQVMTYATNSKATHDKWTVLDDAIRKAAARGVHVQLMVDISDVKKAKTDLSSLAGVKNVEVETVTIPPWSGGTIPYGRLIHSKYMVIDGSLSWIGSENWTRSYFEDTRDVGFSIQDGSLSALVAQVFVKVWQSPYASKVSP
jgi:phosphatidylserine/phosphatidylglycerophosphate/cardiolipin synthase-like enzyme